MQTKTPSSLFANKADLLTAQKRISDLEAELATVRKSPLGAQITALQTQCTALQKENTALKARPLAVTPKTATTAHANISAPLATKEPWKPSAPPPRLTKEQFAQLSPTDKMSFLKAGGRIFN
jgi:hypothetical protein